MPVYEGSIITIDGEREYTRKEFVIAEDDEEASAYFMDELADIFDAENYEESGRKHGYWDDTHETFTYLDWYTLTNGLVIPNTKGGAVFMNFRTRESKDEQEGEKT